VQSQTSEAWAVNANAGVKAVPVSQDSFDIATLAVELAQLSGGAFDPSIGPVSLLWDIESENPHIPTAAELAKALPLVNWHDIKLDTAQRSIFLAKPGMRLDFGGVAKGYAALEAAKICRAAGVTSALLNMGDSTIFALGSKPTGKKWRIGIQNPVQTDADGTLVNRGKMLGVVSVADAVVESSGTYERFFVRDGKTYHHIMNPRTGYPVDNGLVQVTLIVPATTRYADGLSTTVFVLGPEKGMKLVESMDGVAAILVSSDRKVWLSSRAKALFSLDDASFQLAETISRSTK
jgi:thiamine biosynthesis lipoprotein